MNKKLTAAICALAVLVPFLALGTAPDLDPPKWVAALYVEAQRSVGLRWMPVPGAEEYQVLRSTTEGKSHEKIASVIQPQYFDHDVEPAATYYYILKSVAGKRVSAASKEKAVKIPARMQP